MAEPTSDSDDHASKSQTSVDTQSQVSQLAKNRLDPAAIQLEPKTPADIATVTVPELEAATEPFVGRWNRLVSTTNWEKGRIIAQWRDALASSGADGSEYSDEAWSQRVGSVTGQHVGRLRRVYQRFGETQEAFAGLFWSHFQAAIDWEDAEMWLEGAVQNRWSVSQMRRTRWETLGQLPADEEAERVVNAELDEDFESGSVDQPDPPEILAEYADVQGPLDEGPDFGDADEALPSQAQPDDGSAIYAESSEGETIDFVRPFETLPNLPADLLEAFDAFKLAILRHKTDGWQEISSEGVLASLDALKSLVSAPSSAEAPS